MTPANRERALALYGHMRTARRLDELASALASRGEAAFHLAGSGHEGAAALAEHLAPADWLHPHYRDKALILARGFPAEGYLHALLATAGSDAQGRRMPPFVCDPARHLLSIPTLVGNNALQAVGVAAEVQDRPGRPVVVCGIGDGGTQQGEFLEAVAEAARARRPVLFLVEDNHYALSTPTGGRTFYELPGGPPPASFHGVAIERVDGGDALAAGAAFGRIVAAMRSDRAPRIVVLDVERLSSHSNSDDEAVYRPEAERRRARETRDPVANLARALAAAGVADAEIERVHAEIDARLERGLAAARAAAAPVPGPAKRPLPPEHTRPSREYRGHDGGRRLTLLEALRETLRRRLAADPAVRLSGQDLQDPKGDVFGLTRGLSTEFPSRVTNSALSESTIVGEAVGRALAGGKPVAFLQFADFFPLAYNQLFSELGAMYWRTAGRWEAPAIVMAVTGGYRAGLGPYHAQSPEASMVRCAGLDVLLPATAADAAGLLNAAFESGRPTVFLYPKNLLNERSIATSDDVEKQFAPIGRARVVRAGRDLTLVGCGNTVALCAQAAEALEKAGVQAEVIDLRTLSPWDRETVLASATRTGRLIVADEDAHTCGLAGEILATVAQEAPAPVAVARVAAADGFVPYHFENQLETLPSQRRLLEEAARLLDLSLRWEQPEPPEPGIVVVRAIGSSPSDETVRIATLHAREGAAVAEGALLASVEAEKAAFEIASPAAGTIERLLVAEGDQVPVGTPMARLRVPEGAWRPPPASEQAARPVLARRRRKAAAPRPAAARDEGLAVTLSAISSALGAREMDNESILGASNGWNSDDVRQRTGIERRYWIGEGENALTLAVRACRELLERERLGIADIDVLVCSTGTPLSMTPSLACRILKELSPAGGEVMVQAYDLNAACSGYLYALQAAHDFLLNRPDSRILVVTAETLSPVLDRHDPGTLFLFGDAATASLVARERGRGGGPAVRVHRPKLSAKGEDPRVLYVPFPGTGEHVEMAGQQVFRVAVRKMVEMLEQSCEEVGVRVEDLALIVPHQANTRIIESIRQKIRLPPERMFNHIREYGNTSSNTIPLALQQVLPRLAKGDRVGLCAFGGGFTFGAAIVDVL